MIFLLIKKIIFLLELFIRGQTLRISVVFNTQSYFSVSKNIRLSSILFHYENSKQTRPTKNAFNLSSYR